MKTKLRWITNFSQGTDLSWTKPGHKFEDLVEGKPEATPSYSVEELEEMGMLGLYTKKEIKNGR